MRTLLVVAIVSAFASMTLGEVWTSVYRCDERTPLAAADPNHPHVYRDIMVGTHLVIVVSSDMAKYWSGALRISGEDAGCGTLEGRGYVAKPVNYRGSCLEAAGPSARIVPFQDLAGREFSLSTTVFRSVPGHFTAAGDWFILDYYATQAGLCSISLYSHSVEPRVLDETLSFSHVPSRDFNGDTIVDFFDFARLSSQWRVSAETDPNAIDLKLDLNSDQQIGLRDLALFSEYWLERTDCIEPAVDPNSPPENPANPR